MQYDVPTIGFRFIYSALLTRLVLFLMGFRGRFDFAICHQSFNFIAAKRVLGRRLAKKYLVVHGSDLGKPQLRQCLDAADETFARSHALARRLKDNYDVEPSGIVYSGIDAAEIVDLRSKDISLDQGLVITMACLLILSGYVTQPPPMITFMSDRNGVTEGITPIINPTVADHQAVRWANDATSELLSLHFRHYAEQIERRRDLFVGEGWTLYQQSLLDNGVIDKIKESGLIITAVNSNTPRLLGRYEVGGKTNWYIQIPILQTIQGAKESGSTERKIVHITVQEARRDEALQGLQIRLFNIDN